MEEKKPQYLSRFIVCTMCDREKAEYAYKPTPWDNQYICHTCAEYLQQKGLVIIDEVRDQF